LPWNLPLHEQKKRKSQDSVLDPAERAVVRVAGKNDPQRLLAGCCRVEGVWVSVHLHGEVVRGPQSQVSWNLTCCYDDCYCCKEDERTFKRNLKRKKKKRKKRKKKGKKKRKRKPTALLPHAE
jgi:hypothetical protein